MRLGKKLEKVIRICFESFFLPTIYCLLDKSFDRLYFTDKVYYRVTTCAKYNDKNDF